MADAGKKLVRSKSGLRMVSVEDKDTSPFQLDEPPWIPDNQVRFLFVDKTRSINSMPTCCQAVYFVWAVPAKL